MLFQIFFSLQRLALEENENNAAAKLLYYFFFNQVCVYHERVYAEKSLATTGLRGLFHLNKTPKAPIFSPKLCFCR